MVTDDIQDLAADVPIVEPEAAIDVVETPVAPTRAIGTPAAPLRLGLSQDAIALMTPEQCLEQWTDVWEAIR